MQLNRAMNIITYKISTLQVCNSTFLLLLSFKILNYYTKKNCINLSNMIQLYSEVDMNCKRSDLLLYAVTDRKYLKNISLIDAVKQAIDGGVTFVQLREKNIDFDQHLSLAQDISQICHNYHVPFVVNDNIQIAQLSHADGVHLGQKDCSIQKAREILGDNKIIGATARTFEQAKLAYTQGADYIGIGAFFSTSTKQDALPLDRNVVGEIKRKLDVPIVGIGGINSNNITQLKGCGIDGVALSNAIFSSTNITKNCKDLRALALEMVNYK